MRVLVLGGYGLIGTAITKRLIQDGHFVTGIARSKAKGKALIPLANWVEADISTLVAPEHWAEYLKETDVVVNASGALQNGFRDNVGSVQQDAILALVKACELSGVNRFIQISAPGAETNSSTLFYKSKAAADDALKSSNLGWTIFRPGLVISPYAYGGTSLIRRLAAFPVVLPIVMPNAIVQTVAVDDVANAVSIAIEKKLTNLDADLLEDGSQSLLELTLSIRKWLGYNEPKAIWIFPNWVGSVIARIANFAGWLGWRSALRTTSLKVLTDDVIGDQGPWKNASNAKNKSLAETLNILPSTIQERVYARAMLVFPILLLTLACFWIVSGLIGINQSEEAVAKLNESISDGLSKKFVFAGSLTDVIIGAALLFRPLTRLACLASVVVSMGYILASAMFTPHLWMDPLGPMVKVFPVIALAVIVATLLEER